MFEFTQEQLMVQKAVRQWAEKELAPQVDAMERGETLPYGLMRRMAEAFGIPDLARSRIESLSEEKQGDSAKQQWGDDALGVILAMELSRICPGFVLAFGASLGLAGGAIMAKGTLAQKKRFALPILMLEKIGAWAITEPDAGSDTFSGMQTNAKPSGGGYVLNGQKTFITNAPYADILVVYAKIDHGEPPETRPMHGFILERGMKGLATGKPMEKMGMHSSPTGEVFMDDVFVPKEQLLGEKEKAPSKEQARDVFHSERTGMMPMCIGIIDRCLEESVKYAKQRTTWGKPIGEYQLIQEKLARMFVARQNVMNLLFKQLWMQKTGRKMSMAEASACKLYCGRVATEVALEAVQIHGGSGYMREFMVEMFARDAKLLQIGGGTDEVQITTIARDLLKD